MIVDTDSLTAARYDLKDLADRAGVTPRTVHFYIQQGLLAPAGLPGPGASYSEAHLARLVLIRRLQREHLPLAEIRQRLAGLDDGAVIELAASATKADPKATPGETSALDYIRTVLGQQTGWRSEALSPRAFAGMPHPSTDPVRSASAPLVFERSQWDRVVLAPDIELHVRRPLTRDQNRRIERLVLAAKEIFQEGEL